MPRESWRPPRTLLVLFLCSLLSGLLLAGGSGAQEATPSLRLETGAHVAPIRATSMDRDGRYVVTASEDKTARVWDAGSGALLAVFRPPSAAGNDGKLYAVAMTPDGSTFAAAGWSSNNDIYLVRRNDGQIIHRISGLPDVLTHLSFSPDGTMLVAGLWGKQGVRLFLGADGWSSAREMQGDADFSDEVNATAWSPDGKSLIVSSADGFLRAYEVTSKGLKLLSRDTLVGTGIPFGLAFSPDGQSLAVGTADQGNVALLDARTLKQKKQLSPAQAGLSRSLSVVAWSADGKRIYAAGTWTTVKGQFALCVWPDAGMGTPASVIPLTSNTITALHATRDGRLLYASADPAWGILAADGQPLLGIGNNLLDFRNLRSRFRLAGDASGVAFREARPAGAGEAFDIRQLAWAKPGKEWQAPRTMSGRTNIDNWFERQRPLINGKTLTLDAGEWSLSASVSRDGEHVAVATNHKLHLYDRNGRELWRTAAPATPWQINISDDGRWIVAAFSDGTLRWYRQPDGSEQLALFPHADGRRWVMWTTSGHFAASPGGEGLVGWQVERGPAQAADFFPVSRFRAEYYRPELIAEVIGKGIGKATPTALADSGVHPTGGKAILERLPPTVRIVSPDAQSITRDNEVKLQVAVRAPEDAPATQLRARVNGQLVTLPALSALRNMRTKNKGESIFEVPLSLPMLDAQILLFAENKHGVSSEAALTVKRPPIELPREQDQATLSTPAGQSGPAGVDLRPNLYVLAIGVSKYQDPSIQLEFAAKDSTDLSNFLKTQEGGLYRKVSVRLLTDSGAKRDDVLDGLEWIRRELTARDVAMVFIAGHGVNDSDSTYYFLPQDVNIKSLKRTGVIFTEIRNTLVSLPGKAMFFIDTCHAGNVLGTGTRSLRMDTTAVVNELSSADNGVIVFAAATGRQYAQESPDWGNGAFTKAILEGLRGQADYNKSGRITHKMLDLYVSERVKGLTEGAQSPVTIVPSGVPDFPLVLGKR